MCTSYTEMIETVVIFNDSFSEINRMFIDEGIIT